tara:strand:- start:719 stop:1186 length:468 start_codon:yes stop_codon:yes gene_type:complete
MTSPLDRFGYTEEGLDEVLEAKKAEVASRRDPRICSCGHPVKFHTVTAYGTSCKPGRLLCPCTGVFAVITVPDTRYFMRKSDGNGKLHALTLGIHSAIKANPDSIDKFEWIIDNACGKCGNEEVQLHPTNLTPNGVIVDKAAEFSLLLCDDCRFG